MSITAAGQVPRTRQKPVSPRASAIAVVAVAARPRNKPAAGQGLRTKDFDGDVVAKHVLLQRSRGVAGKDQTLVVFEQVTRLLNEQLLGARKETEIVGPRHNLEAAQVLTTGRSSA
jgi:hypothetical protein